MDKKEHTEDRLIDLLNESQEKAEPGQTDQPRAEEETADQPRTEEETADQPQAEEHPSKHQKKQMAKNQAREEVRELAQEIREEKRSRKARRRQQKEEEKRKYPTAGLRRKARRLRWKKEKAARRNDLKDRYQDAPWIVRISRLYLLKPFIVLLVMAGIVAGVVASGLNPMEKIIESLWQSKDNPVSQEKIYERSPVDEAGAKRIDAVAPVDKDDTWTISVYIVGSNLEDMNENDLSQVILSQVQGIQEKNEKKSLKGYQKRLANFSDELDENDLELPAYLYYPIKPVKPNSEGQEESEPVIAEAPGCASNDIDEMTSETWSEKIRIVIQTGGATRWSNTMVNPNRTQRFLYHKGVFSEVDDQPLQPASEPETLTSFLNFCKENYPADHNMLVLWNHGGGAFGYGSDSIYGNMMSLKDLRQALKGAYEPDEKDPAFDVIGFDACLMASLEATHALNGFASYYAVSEETEPGDGWDYEPWLKAMTKDPTMNPAKIAQNIADSYMDYYITENINVGWLYASDVTFSVLDASKTEDLYEAWCDLTRQQLIDAATDSSVLSDIGRCSKKSTHFVSSEYNMYNTIDLGNYADLMVDRYPKECSRIKKLIGESVMYHRQCGALSDAQGISVYLPGSVNNYGGLAMCLDYIYNICDDPSTRALYYYKIAGCLNEDMKEHLATLTEDEARTLDLKPFRQFEKTEPVITDQGFSIAIDDKLLEMIQNYETEAALYDKEAQTVTSYGRDETVSLDGEGNVNCEFDGTWICYDGVPLATEVVSSTESSVEYRSRVYYNGKECYLSFTWDRDAEEFTVNGVKGASELSGLIASDPINFMFNSRMNTELKEGDRIAPIYDVQDYSADKKEDVSEDEEPDRGETIRVSKNSKISIDKLPSGYYLTSAVIGDQRGDVYYSPVVGNKVSGGKVGSRKVDTNFLGREY